MSPSLPRRFIMSLLATLAFLATTSLDKLQAQGDSTQYSFGILAGFSPDGSSDSTATSASFSYPCGVAVDISGNVYVGHNYEIRKITLDGVVSTLAGSDNLGNTDGPGANASFASPAGIAVDASGNVYVADTYNHKIRKISPTGVVSTLAGSGAVGSTDGPGANACFSYPTSVAVDASGNVYVADSDNHKIRKISRTGVVSTLAGSSSEGSTDGTGTGASFRSPTGVAVDASGNVYVADYYNHKIRKISRTGVVSTLAGSESEGNTDSTSVNARFAYPHDVAVDASGNVYVTDRGNHKIRKISPSGVVSTLAGSGSEGSNDGTGANASFYFPNGVAVDTSGNVYVADTNNHKIRKISPSCVVETFAGSGFQGRTNGAGTCASLSYPTSVALDAIGNVYVADSGNHKIRRISPSGMVSTFAGSGSEGSTDGTGTGASFRSPTGVAVDASGNVYVADYYNHKIRKISPTGVVSTLAGSESEGDTDGTSANARFAYPHDVAVDASGNVYVADRGNHKIRKISPTGVVSTLAGSGSQGSADGTGRSASFYYPTGVAVDTGGDVYVADTSSNKIRKISPAGVVSTLAGAARAGNSDGTGSSASFSYPTGVAVDTGGNVYVADSGNHKIRRISPAGVVSTLAGSGSQGSNDALSTSARFYNPTGVAVDASGNVYVGDADNHKIREISLNGIVETLAGSGSKGSTDGAGTRGSFSHPYSVALDAIGNVYVADSGNHKIHRISPSGMVSTLAGSGAQGNSDGTGSSASFSYPTGIAVDTGGNVYVADSGNHKIRKISPTGVVITLAGSGSQGGTDGPGANASFNGPKGVAVDASGNVYVAGGSNKVRKISPIGVVSTLAGSDTPGSTDDTGVHASFRYPTGVAVDASGNIYVADRGNHKIRKISPTGVVSTLAGSDSPGSYDGPGIWASFHTPEGVAVDASGNVYVADTVNCKIRRISSNSVVSTLAGTGSEGNADGTIASFSYPYGVAVDASGNIYVADTENHTIRKGKEMRYQTITFNPLTNITFTTKPITLDATASSRLPVTLCVISGPAAISGNTLTLTDVGEIVLGANQAGDANYLAAAEVTTSFEVSKATQTTGVFANIANKAFGDAPFTVTVPTATSGLPVTWSVKSGPATISGNMVTITGVGEVVIAANQAGNANYAAATEVTTSFMVSKSAQTIGSFANIANKTFGDAPFTVTVPTATSNLPVTLSVKSGPATISGNIVTITSVGEVVLIANQAGNQNYNKASEVTTGFSVSKAPQSIILPPSPPTWPPFPPSIGDTIPLPELVASSGLPVTWSVSGPATISGNTMTIIGAGTVVLAANQAGNDNYNAATEVTTSFTVSKATQTIGIFANIANKTFGDAPFTVTAPTATSGLPVTLSVKSGQATISGNTMTIIGAGTVVLAANQAGNDSYLPASEVTTTFAVLDMKNMTGDFIGNYDLKDALSPQAGYDGNGQLSVKIAKGGGFSGSLVISGSRVAVKSKFDSEGKASLVVKNKIIGDINMNLLIKPLNRSDLKIDASITRRNGAPFDFICYPVAYAGTGGEKNFPLGGRQINSLMASQATSGIDFGHGFAMIKTSKDGTLKFTGRAADGSTITGATRLVKDAFGDILAPVSFPLSAVKGLLHGVADIDSNPEEGQYHLASSSEWTWVRLPQTKAKTYKEGFAEKLGVYGQVWSFTKGQSVLPEAKDGFTFQVDPDSVLLEEPLELSGKWPSSNKPVWDVAPPKGFTFKVNTATGQISGAAPRKVNGKAAKALSYQGLLVRPALDSYDGAPLLGGGYILGTESSGAVEITTP